MIGVSTRPDLESEVLKAFQHLVGIVPEPFETLGFIVDYVKRGALLLQPMPAGGLH